MDFSSLFVRDPSFAFLNAGTLSRTPLAILDLMDARRREEERNPTKTSYGSVGVCWRAQVALAAYLGAEPDDLFLRSNITDAFSDFLFALPLPADGEILVTGLEYGAMTNAARVRAAQAGIRFRAVPLPLSPRVTGADLAAAVIAELKDDTRALVVSHVATGTGSVLPVEEIGRAAHARGVVTMVDGAHAIGSRALKLGALPVDFYGGNLHKWFLGPKGMGFGWTHSRWRTGLDWRFGGWASFGKPAHYGEWGGSEEAARRLFPGTMDTLPFGTIPDLLQFWAEHGPDRLRARQAALRDLAAEEAAALGWERVSPLGPEDLGPLVAFRPPVAWREQPSVPLATRLYREARVQVALPSVQGEMLVRFSPGVYGSEEEVREGIRRLQNFV